MSDANSSCSPMSHSGNYQLQSKEELVAVSYPGPPRLGGLASATPAPHDLARPDLVPIITVHCASGGLDVVVETFPHEHWFDGGGTDTPPPHDDPPPPYGDPYPPRTRE